MPTNVVPTFFRGRPRTLSIVQFEKQEVTNSPVTQYIKDSPGSFEIIKDSGAKHTSYFTESDNQMPYLVLVKTGPDGTYPASIFLQFSVKYLIGHGSPFVSNN